MAFPSASDSFRVTGTFVRFDGTPVEGLAVNFIPPRAVQAVQNYEDDSVYPTFAVTGVTDENGKLFAAKDVDNPDREEGVELLFPYGKSLSVKDWHYIAEFVDPATNKSTRLLVNVPNPNVNLIPNGSGEFGDFGGWASFTGMTDLTWETTDAPAGAAGYLRSTWAGAKTTAADAIEVDPDGEYLIEVWIRADKPDSRLYLDARAGTSDSRVGVTKAVPGYESGSSNGVSDPPAGYIIQNKPVPTTWTRVVGAFTPNGESSIRIGGLITNHTTGTVQDAVVDIGGLRLSPMPVESVDLSDAIPIGKRDDFDEDLEIYLQAVKDAREARDEAVAAAAYLPSATVSSGEVVGDDLILTRTDTSTVNAGNVRGPQGPPSALTFDVETLDPGDEPTLDITGDPGNYNLSIGLPVGPEWSAEAVPVEPGGDPFVDVEGTWPMQLLKIGIPEGIQGETGSPANLSVEAVTLPPGSQATASLSGTAPDFTLSLGIPRGDTGPATAAFDDSTVSNETGWTSSAISASLSSMGQQFASLLNDKASLNHSHSASDISTGTLAAARIPAATQTQAEQGTVTTGFMTPLRTKQAFVSFTKEPSNAVFIGASNVVPGTWPEKLCTKLGLTARNFAVGGTGFTHGGPYNASWSTQLTSAINSTAFSNSDVKYVFVAGGGNDARASGSPSVLTLARSLFTDAVANFPNAKLVVVPMLWNDGVVIPNAIRVAEEMRTAAREVGGQVIWHAWEWIYGHSEWMADATHPNAAGYDQFVQWIMQGLNGSPTYVSDSGIPSLGSGPGVSIRTRLYWQVNAGIASITGDINLSTQNPSSGTILLRVPRHAAPGNTTPVPVNVDVGAWSTTATCFIYNDGYVRAYTAPGGTGGSLAINANWTHTM